MIIKLGEKFTDTFQRYMPNAFVFAILLTLLVAVGAFIWLDSTPLEIIESWYGGFFDLLPFAMQIVLIVITGFSIALSPIVKRGIDYLTRYINTPGLVYFSVVMIGMLLSLVSFGWLVITCVFARELALRVKGVNYPFLIACVYFTLNSWVMGLSSAIPLFLNTGENILIQKELLSDVIPTSYTLGSSLNIAMMLLLVIGAPLLMMLLRPKTANKKELSDLMVTSGVVKQQTIQEEAASLKLPYSSLSDKLNSSSVLQMLIVIMGLAYIVFHFSTKGFDLNLNIMIFIFLIVGLFLHKTPSRYVISMKRSSNNISGVLFQYPFYAGIMGIMISTGLGGGNRTIDGLGGNHRFISILCLYPWRYSKFCHSISRR
jgi:short-chain fatty acids transporter